MIHIEIVSTEDDCGGFLRFKSLTPELRTLITRLILGPEFNVLFQNYQNAKLRKEETTLVVPKENNVWVPINDEIAEQMGCSKSSIRCWISQKKVRSKLVYDDDGIGRRLVHYKDLQNFIKAKNNGHHKRGNKK